MKNLSLNKEIILVDKPKGISSFDVIRILRKRLGIKKMGHAGTLDPLASGLMLVAVGKATKKLKNLLNLPKVYQAEIILGLKTDTGDLEGKILEEKEIKEIDIEKVKNVIKDLKGKLFLKAPLYSALKINGVPLYKLARKGKKVDPPIKEMTVLQAKFLGLKRKKDFFTVKILFRVKSGTYIRSLAEEIGRRLNLPSTLGQLRRTQIGKYKVEQAAKLK